MYCGHSDLLLQMQSTINNMAAELGEMRKMNEELKENQKKLADLVEKFTEKSVETATQTDSSARKPEKHFLTPTVAGCLRNMLLSQSEIEKNLEMIKQSPNWREQFMDFDTLNKLKDISMKLNNPKDKDQMVRFLHDQSKYLDSNAYKDDTTRMKIIVNGLLSTPDSILYNHYKMELGNFVRVCSPTPVELIDESAELVAEGLFTVLDCSSDEEAINEAVSLLIPLCQKVEWHILSAYVSREQIQSLVRLLDPDAQPQYLINSVKLLWILIDAGKLDEGYEQYLYSITKPDRVDKDFLQYSNDRSSFILRKLFDVFSENAEYRQMSRQILKDAAHSTETKILLGGVLALHLTGDNPDHHVCSQLLLEQIPQWNAPVPISVNISLAHLARLLRSDEPACHLYASWFLANLLSTNETKYLPIIKKYVIFSETLTGIYSDLNTIDLTKKLIKEVLTQLYYPHPESEWPRVHPYFHCMIDDMNKFS